jgi:hypothetical protein
MTERGFRRRGMVVAAAVRVGVGSTTTRPIAAAPVELAIAVEWLRLPLVSFQINRQLSGWILPPLIIRAFGRTAKRRHASVAQRSIMGAGILRPESYAAKLQELKYPATTCAVSIQQ